MTVFNSILKSVLILILFSPIPSVHAEGEYPRTMIVEAEVADVRAKPIPHSRRYENDPLQETQVLKGEPVIVHEKENGWYRVECPEQREFTHSNRWEGYPGWIQADDLTANLSKKRSPVKPAVPLSELRGKIIKSAESHLGTPYLWGGRSLHNPRIKKAATGVDCSGLVNWSYREAGWLVPRDSHEQFMEAEKIQPSEMQPGDLVFLAKPDKPDRVVHVMLYAGGEDLLEGPQTGEKIRRITFRGKFSKPLSQIAYGETIGERVVYFGSFLKQEEK